MRIGIDYTAAVRQGGGIGRYARELTRAILSLHSGATFAVMAGVGGMRAAWKAEAAQLRELAAPGSLTTHPIPLSDDWLARIWQRLRAPLPAELVTGRVDLFYSPDFVLPPLLRNTRSLLTIHDLSFMRHPETFPDALRAYLEASVPRSVARADHILADSHSTRRDVIELFGAPEDRVTTLHLGVAARFQPQPEPGERATLQARYGIGERRYILAVGTVQPRKNYVHLMEACEPLAERDAVDLVIAGRPAWLAEPILAAAAARPFVKMMHFFDDGDLPALYRQAAALAFPSLYEGFGLPPLEAMACGTPVVASTASSVPEVVGEAGILLDPDDTQAWTGALSRMIEDRDLANELAKRGLRQARKFTWEATAKAWLDLVKRIAL